MTITSPYLALCSSTSSLAQRAGFFYAAGAFRLSFQVDTNACLACPLPLKEDTLGPTTAFDSDLGQAEKARATPRLALVSVTDARLRYPVEMRRTVFFVMSAFVVVVVVVVAVVFVAVVAVVIFASLHLSLLTFLAILFRNTAMCNASAHLTVSFPRGAYVSG